MSFGTWLVSWGWGGCLLGIKLEDPSACDLRPCLILCPERDIAGKNVSWLIEVDAMITVRTPQRHRIERAAVRAPGMPGTLVPAKQAPQEGARFARAQHGPWPRSCKGMISAASAVVACLAACSGSSNTPPAGPTSNSAAPSPSATVRPSAAPAGPLTGPELLWLQTVAREQVKINNALTKEPATPTQAQMLTVASVLRGCTTTINRLGRPSDPRLLPVYEPMVKACAQFAKAAKCQTTLAVSQDNGQVNKAAACMSATTLTGGTEMAASSQAILNLQNPTS